MRDARSYSFLTHWTSQKQKSDLVSFFPMPLEEAFLRVFDASHQCQWVGQYVDDLSRRALAPERHVILEGVRVIPGT